MHLFVGMASFLPAWLIALRDVIDARETHLVVLDNDSTDGTADIARRFGAEVIVRRSGQAYALMDLFNRSRAEFTLLLDADVVLPDRRWLDVCAAHLTGNVALVSPEDIGCGPYTRPWGRVLS